MLNFYDFIAAAKNPGVPEMRAILKHTDHILRIVQERQHVEDLSAGVKVWRARADYIEVTDEHGGKVNIHPHSGTDLSAPPTHLATAGRFNRKGERFLYLANSQDVALAEIKPASGTSCSVGRFEILVPQKIVFLIPDPDFAELPHLVGDKIDDDGMYWDQLVNYASRQVTSAHAHDHYMLTQLVASCFRDAGFDGIAYKTSFHNPTWDAPETDADHPKGIHNLVLFNPDNAANIMAQVASISWTRPALDEDTSTRINIPLSDK